MKKLISLLLCVVMLVCALTSCSPPPEFSEIEGRLAELIEASYEINRIFFGEGLSAYEHVMDPQDAMEVLRSDDGLMTYYYEIQDPSFGLVIAYRKTMLEYSFAQVLESADEGREAIWSADGLYAYALPDYTHKKTDENTVEQIKDEAMGKTTYYYEIEDETYGRVVAHRYSSFKYSYVQITNTSDASREAIWSDSGKYAYALPDYVEPEHEYFYVESDPEYYDYVRMDEKYGSISEIKQAAELVYSKDYLSSLYTAQFDGAATGQNLSMLTARYMEHTDEQGNTKLMKSNTFEPYVTEKRIFDLSTAKIIDPKRSNFVTIEIESYYESTPENRFTGKLTMILQDDGQWYLDSGTY